jgi:2-polyprenyl-6-methoxyphenol hydroxylase-like FAD-dependent oxidoreductase
MQSVGVINELVPKIVLGYGSEYFSPAGRRFLTVKPTTLEYGYSRRNAFRQPVLELILRDNLSRYVNATIWFETELVEFAQSEEAVTARVRRHGEIVELTCDYLVGCDGARSFVRQSLGIEMHGSTFRERWLIIDLEQTTDLTRDTKVYCNPMRRASRCLVPTARGGSSSCSTMASRTTMFWRRTMSRRCYGYTGRTTGPCFAAKSFTRFMLAWPIAGEPAGSFLPATPRISRRHSQARV